MCVQGTDGCALYGTDPIEEELSLEKLLDLSFEELCRMRQSEERSWRRAARLLKRNPAQVQSDFPSGDSERYYCALLEKTEQNAGILWQTSEKTDAEEALRDQLSELPEDGFPMIIAGGSFNNSSHRSTLRADDREFLEALLENANPEKAFFVIGHSLTGQEAFLVQQAAGRFRIFAIVPRLISRAEKTRLQKGRGQCAAEH